MFYEKKPGQLIITLKITTKTSKTQLLLPENEASWARLKISAVPEKGKANKAIIDFLAKNLKVPKSNINIIKGELNPLKTISISGEPQDLLQKIENLSTST
jgi:hypothetical protein